MNTNDLPPAARLAALIEAGRAANPSISHGRQVLYRNGAACALGFAYLGVGHSEDELANQKTDAWVVCDALGLPWNFPGHSLALEVAVTNDRGASLDAICQSLREGELAKVAA